MSDAEEMEKLHIEQEKALKRTIRELERSSKRENANIEYLKNVLVKFLLFDDQEVVQTAQDIHTLGTHSCAVHCFGILS